MGLTLPDGKFVIGFGAVRLGGLAGGKEGEAGGKEGEAGRVWHYHP